MATKGKSTLIRLVAESGNYFYIRSKSKAMKGTKMQLRKYNPNTRRYEIFKEAKA